MQVAFPSFLEQKVIVQKVESLMGKCRALEAEINQSEQHAQMLMQAVLKEAFEEDKKGSDSKYEDGSSREFNMAAEDSMKYH